MFHTSVIDHEDTATETGTKVVLSAAGSIFTRSSQRAGHKSVIETDPVEGHTAKALDQALSELRIHAVGMGGLAIDQVTAAVHALLAGDSDTADLVLSREARINQLDRKIDREAFRLVALHQPVAGDLRMARGVSRVIVDLERAGDEAKKIARFAQRVAAGEPNEPVAVVAKSLRHMAELSASMLRQAVRALDESDAALACEVTIRDVELDREFERALRRLLTLVMEGEPYLRATIDTVFALKGLERIGDHSKNIAEQVLYIIGEHGDISE